ncbi:MAG TPA: transposase [Anaerolineales bacterium]
MVIEEIAITGNTFQRCGQVNKPVKDVRVRNVKVYGYRCCQCIRTSRHYPEGDSSADQTERLHVFAILLWTFGLSHRASSLILSGLQVLVSHMTIWRHVQEHAKHLKKRNHWKPVRVLGLDRAHVLGRGEKQAVLVAVDLGTGEPIPVGYINEYDLQAIRCWREPLLQRHGITVIVKDDLSSYKIVAEKLQLGHQICQVHVWRWAGKTLTVLQEAIPEEWLWVVDEIHQLLDLLLPDGSQTLYALWRQLPGRRSKRNQTRSALEQLRDLLLRLIQDWQHYCTFQFEPVVSWTNNATERAIGRMKIRARTVRAYKSWPGMESGLLLAGSFTS